ncbi:MAG: hypothetical protein HY901_19120 [Deltaproteobacteria bacterium]|nr:hypothetical protein [Deltaproteobacteria bacterium]
MPRPLSHGQPRDHPGTRIVVVRASHDLLARRLRDRRRESAQALAEREARNLLWPELRGDLEVVNQGRIEDAVRTLTDGVLRWLAG